MPIIDVIVASSDEYLTTTGRVRNALGLTSAQTSEDANISVSILAASKWAEGYVGYPLSAQKYRECLPSYGTRSLKLFRYPVRAVPLLYNTTSTEDGTQVETSEYQLNAAAGLIQRPTGWAWSAPSEVYLDSRPLVGQEFPDWLADYVAGYTYGGVDTGSSLWSTEKGTTSTGRTLPQDIEEAVIAKAVGIYEQTEDVVEEKVGDLSVRYQGAFASSAKKSVSETILERYVRTA
jgi:hypothetical protein